MSVSWPSDLVSKLEENVTYPRKARGATHGAYGGGAEHTALTVRKLHNSRAKSRKRAAEAPTRLRHA